VYHHNIELITVIGFRRGHEAPIGGIFVKAFGQSHYFEAMLRTGDKAVQEACLKAALVSGSTKMLRNARIHIILVILIALASFFLVRLRTAGGVILDNASDGQSNC